MNKLKRIIAAILAAVVVEMPFAAIAENYSELAASSAGIIALEDAPEADETEETDERNQYSKNYKNYEMLAKYIEEYYIDDSVTAEEAMKGGISHYVDGDDEKLALLLKAMFQNLDPWSDFFTKSEYEDFTNEVNKTFYGIGVQITEKDGYVEISGFSEENSLAERTGFMVGDKFVKVAGVECEGKSTSEVRSLIIGDLDTTVDITVLRDGQLVDITATRTQVHAATATSTVLPGNIGYLRIISFGETTAVEVGEILDSYVSEGVKKFILDLRNNGGGHLESAVTIAKMLVPKGKIVDVVFRNEQNNTSYYSERTTKDFEMITLVNGNTASSAEILASAIQDSHAGRLLGETTYGKAVIQQIFPLQNRNYFKLTIGEYKTRNGRSINYVGLEPDEYVKNYNEPIDSTKYTRFDFSTKSSIGDFSKNALSAKEKLRLLGYYNGNADNEVFTAELKDAIKKFQAAYGLAATGVLDIPTQVKLEKTFEDLKIEVDLQLETAYEQLGGIKEDLYDEK
ncbi:MAG: S41 family peptidase [bacterium]|nr:S41 family peptidase [bacterium]